MRNYRAQVEGRPYVAVVEPVDKSRMRVRLEGEEFLVERVVREDVAAWRILSGDEVVHAQTRLIQSDKIDVWMRGVVFPSSVQEIGSGLTVPHRATGGGLVGEEVRALMPGRITSVLVREGEDVGVGAPLIILEAMKMQNEIASPTTGRVKSIRVAEGETVKKDAVLVVLE